MTYWKLMLDEFNTISDFILQDFEENPYSRHPKNLPSLARNETDSIHHALLNDYSMNAQERTDFDANQCDPFENC